MLKVKILENKRVGQRLLVAAAIDLAIILKPFWAFLLRPQFSGSLVNISIQGMQLKIDRSLPPGATLKLWVRMDHQKRIFNLVLRGEVMWTKPSEESGLFLVGIQLMDTNSPAMDIWAASTLDEIRHFER